MMERLTAIMAGLTILLVFYALAYAAVAFIVVDLHWVMTATVGGRALFLASPAILGMFVLAMALFQ